LLLDTGANNVGIDENLAEKIGLAHVDTQEVHGSVGAFDAKVYSAKLCIPIIDANGERGIFATNLNAYGTKDFGDVPLSVEIRGAGIAG
jgi:predicted aspartyl protease